MGDARGTVALPQKDRSFEAPVDPGSILAASQLALVALGLLARVSLLGDARFDNSNDATTGRSL